MSFTTQLSRIINANQSRSVLLTGNINDLFWDGKNYVPLIPFLAGRYACEPQNRTKGVLPIVYEINDEIRVRGDATRLRECWAAIAPADDSFDTRCQQAKGNPTFALEFLRTLTSYAQRSASIPYDLLVLIEGADMIIPESEMSRMQVPDRRRVAILNDWFCDPEFMNGGNSVVLISESSALLHNKVVRLPQVLEIEVQAPDIEARRAFIQHKRPDCQLPVAELTAGLSLHALRQLLCVKELTIETINNKVEQFIISQIGEGIIEFKKPTHKLDQVRGFRKVKDFLKQKLIPGFLAGPEKALRGAAFGGPIGGGKTYLAEAVAGEIGIPVIVLKNLRSKWFGETDVITERLFRFLRVMDRVLISLDEADTQFGNIESEDHSTEKRLTGSIQNMMSDDRLRGKVMWLLMTARIHLLSPDIRRPGRAGDLIIPILDPEHEDFDDFVNWAFSGWTLTDPQREKIKKTLTGYSAASFSTLRSQIKLAECKTVEEALDIADDIILADIAGTRRLQTLEALMNCTRKSLLPCPRDRVDENRECWREEANKLRMKGYS